MMSFEGSNEDIDPCLRDLASDIGRKSENTVYEVVVKLKDLLYSKSVEDSGELRKFKQDLHTTNLLQFCSDALKCNYNIVQGGYQTAAQMADIVSTCCVGLHVVENKEEFYSQFLPSVADNLMSLAVCLLKTLDQVKDPSEIIRQFGKITGSICWLLKGYSQLIPYVLMSKNYEKIQLSDNEDIGTVSLLFLQNLMEANRAFLTEIKHSILNGILEDIVYKLGCSSTPAIGNAAVKTLLLIGMSHHSFAEFIPKKYPGLDALLKNEWLGKGFDAEVEQLINLLYSAVQHKGASAAMPEERVKAACVIQAAWRAHRTRQRVRMLPKAVSALQRSFRERKRQKDLHYERTKAEKELTVQRGLRRQRALREFRQRQLYLLDQVPANQVDSYLREVERRAAVVIQKAWRGHWERMTFRVRVESLKQHKAAVTIQRAVLRFLRQRRIVRPAVSPWKGPQGLTDARRTELSKEVEEYISLHPSKSVSVESCRELHARTQQLLWQHVMRKDEDQRAEQHRKALLVQINTDIELLMNAPSFNDSATLDPDVYLSRFGPVASLARQSHNALLQASRNPWWKNFGNRLSDLESMPADNLDIQFDSLQFGGSP